MGLLMLFFGGVAKDVLAATVFLRRRQNAQADEIVRCWRRQRRKIPFANWYLKRKAGKPVGFVETKRNAAIVNGARALVNSETFEHLVGAVLNKRSKLKFKMPNALKKGGSGIPRRHWGKVTIVS
jgi:hypothetical protein